MSEAAALAARFVGFRVHQDVRFREMALWSPHSGHGSGVDRSSGDRCFLLNSYVRAENSDRGEWAFKGGES